MSGINRREHKKKISEAGISEACKVIKDASLWESALPECIDKVNSPRADIRLAALQSMNEILSGKYIGADLVDLREGIYECLIDPITSPVSKAEHDEALCVMCNLALNQYSDMESEALSFLDELMPSIPATTTERNTRFFAIAFVSAFTIENNEKCEAVLSRFAGLISNKKKRTVPFEPETISEIIDAIALILSILPSTTCVGSIASEVAAAIDIALGSSSLDVLESALDALPIIYECIAEVQDCEELDEYEADVSHFAAKYKNKIINLADKMEKKADRKTIADKVKNVLEFFESGEVSESVTFNEQEVEIDGARKILIMSAIRRVTKHHFATMVTQNLGIHDAIGFEIKRDAKFILHKKRKEKKETVKVRNSSTRDRQKDLAKKRKMKEDRYNGEGDFADF